MKRLVLVLGLLGLVALFKTPARGDELSDAYARASSLHKAGKYQEALKEYEAVVKMSARQLGEQHGDTTYYRNSMALVLADLGRFEEAEVIQRDNLKTYAKTSGKDHPNYATGLVNLAALLKAMGRYRDAESAYLQGLAILERKLGKDHTHVAGTLSNLAGLYKLTGEYEKAEPLLLRSLAIRETALGKNHDEVGLVLNNLAGLYKSTGQFDKAEPLYLRSLAIREARLGKSHPLVATTLNNVAELYRAMKKYEKAETLYQRAVEIHESKLGKEHLSTANSLGNLAGLYREMGKLDKAEALYTRALAIREAKNGKDHPETATTLNNMGIMYRDMGQVDKAEKMYRRSLEIRETKLDKDHPSAAITRNNLAMLYVTSDRLPEAIDLFERVRRSVVRHTHRVLPALSEPEQQAYLRENVVRNLHGALSIALLKQNDPELAARTASWLLNGKALGHQAMAERTLLSRDSQENEIIQQLLAVRKLLSRLALQSATPGSELSKLLAELAGKEQNLTKKLARTNPRFASRDPWVDLADVREKLPADSVLIDIACFPVRDYHPKDHLKPWQPARYVAWVIPPKGDVRVIDLGPASKIDEAGAKVRQDLLEARGTAEKQSTILTKGEADAEKIIQESLADLSRLVLDPLLPMIKDRKHWIISPDSSLWLVPWSALLVDKKYAIEKHSISYVVSGRDLVSGARDAKLQRQPAAIVADPDFDMEPKGAGTDGVRGRTSRSQLPRFDRLPGTATEARAIEPKLGEWTKTKVRVFKEDQALEGSVKALRNPRILVLSTHGFFLEDQDSSGNNQENPLLRCGLILAGCNNRDKIRNNDEDGVLTGLEIVGTDLRGTDLVVLSACETGLGKVRNGEGVAGLRQAFQLAGAQSVVATLWQIPDLQSARLMSEFFDALANGKDNVEAMAEAQRKIIALRRKKNDSAHPFFWAAFTITGR